jgi:phosphonoacetaldehyde hydrolase
MNEHKIKAVILDWAGTTVDFGSFAPVGAFTAAFEAFGVTPSVEETRAPMGLPKRAHIERMLEGDRMAALWRERHGGPHTEDDVNRIYSQFEPALFRVLEEYAAPLPGVVDAVRELRDMGVAIGSTTGYTSAMMDIVAPLAAHAGYAPDCIVCPDDANGTGRPYPYMLWRNLEEFGVMSIAEALKVGDTSADMREGKNAGCLCVGVIKGSSMLGLSEAEYEALDESRARILFDEAKRGYAESGADYVIGDIGELTALVRELNGGGGHV